MKMFPSPQLGFFVFLVSALFFCKAEAILFEEGCKPGVTLNYHISSQSRATVLNKTDNYTDVFIHEPFGHIVISCTVSPKGMRFFHDAHGYIFKDNDSFTISTDDDENGNSCEHYFTTIQADPYSFSDGVFSCGIVGRKDTHKLHIVAGVNIPVLRQLAKRNATAANQTASVPIILGHKDEMIEFTPHLKSVCCMASGYPLPEFSWILRGESFEHHLSKTTPNFFTFVKGNQVTEKLCLIDILNYPTYANISKDSFQVICVASSSSGNTSKTFNVVPYDLIFGFPKSFLIFLVIPLLFGFGTSLFSYHSRCEMCGQSHFVFKKCPVNNGISPQRNVRVALPTEIRPPRPTTLDISGKCRKVRFVGLPTEIRPRAGPRRH